MDATPTNQAVRTLQCTCGRIHPVGAVYCDACGQAVAYTDVTVRLQARAATSMTIPLPATEATVRLPAPVLFNDPHVDVARLLAAIREGMVVRSADGKRLGKVIQVHVREPEVYLQVLSGAGRWKPRFETTGLYIPASAIAEVDDRQVRLTMDASAAKGCTFRPSWIPYLRVPDGGTVGN